MPVEIPPDLRSYLDGASRSIVGKPLTESLSIDLHSAAASLRRNSPLLFYTWKVGPALGWRANWRRARCGSTWTDRGE